jgi:TonB-linked SusC/RagA family outer membrane protein
VRAFGVWITLLAAGVGAAGTAAAQERLVSGTVTRASGGQPITEATVSVAGSRATAKTNDQGRYTISVGPGDARLTIRAIGFRSAEVSVPAGVESADAALTEDIFKLEELVVSGQQTGVERRSATTSTAIVTNEDLTQVGAATLDQALQGKIAGANIEQNSGGPGGGLQIRVRGANTAIGQADPLFVVDGVIYSNATLPSGLFSVTASSLNRGRGELQDDAVNRLADLNPADIASVEVLKGAAASSIYGSKAANGVVVITTNRGRVGKPKVNVTQRLGFYELLRGPGGGRAFTPASAFATFSEHDPGETPKLDSAVVQSYIVNGQLPYYDHLQEVAGNRPFAWETVADVSGGDDNTKYYISGAWTDNPGIVTNTFAKKQSLRLNLDQQLGSRFKLQASSAFTRNQTDRGITNNDNNGGSVTYALAYIPSFLPLLNPDGSFREPEVTYLQGNPVQTAALSTNDELVNRFTGAANLSFQAFTTERSSLKLVAAAGADIFNQKATVIAPPELFFQQTQANPGVSSLANGDSRFLNWNLNAIHTYTPASASWRATTSVGSQYEDRNLNRSQVVAQGLIPGQTNINQGSVFGNQFELQTTERTLAFYGQEEFAALRDRLLLTVGVRAERSSANGDDGTYYFFPKFSGAYRFANLLGAGSDLKLRGAYGESGNQPLFGQKFTTLEGNNTIGGVIGTQVGQTSGAPAIKPERIKEFEGGFDASLWQGRATFEFTAYHRRTTDLLLNLTPAPSTGFTQQIVNGGQFRNSGFEVAMGVSPVQQRNFTWLLRSTFNRVRTRVDALPGGITSYRPQNAGFGLAFGEFLVQTGQPITQIVGSVPDQNGDLQTVFLGQANPDFRLSLSNDFTLGRLFFSFLWEWQQGGVAQNQTISLYDCNGLSPDFDGPDVTNPDGTVRPRGQYGFDACNFTGDARPFVESTTFLKLRELSLGVSLPRRWARAFAGANDVRVSVTGRNLLLFTGYHAYDPEVSNYGQQSIVRNIDLAPYPPMRSFLFNISLGF